MENQIILTLTLRDPNGGPKARDVTLERGRLPGRIRYLDQLQHSGHSLIPEILFFQPNSAITEPTVLLRPRVPKNLAQKIAYKLANGSYLTVLIPFELL